MDGDIMLPTLQTRFGRNEDTEVNSNRSNAGGVRINDGIRSKQVMLIGPTGQQAGIVDTGIALRLAEDAGLDLVEVNPNAKPPVAKLMDYGKMKYEADKARKKQARKAANAAEVKEIRLGVNTGEHDMRRMADHAAEFLNDGHKVRITVMMKGRQRANPEAARAVIEKFAGMVGTGSVSASKNSGKSVGAVITPNRK